MGRIFYIFFLFFIIGVLTFTLRKIWEKAENTPTNSEYATMFFKGEHELFSLKNFSETEKKSQGSFYVVIGNYSSEEKNVEYACFSWLNNQGEYVISKIPLSKVRFKLITDDEKPFCTFSWYSYNGFTESEWWNSVEFVVLNIKESQITRQVNLTL